MVWLPPNHACNVAVAIVVSLLGVVGGELTGQVSQVQPTLAAEPLGVAVVQAQAPVGTLVGLPAGQVQGVQQAPTAGTINARGVQAQVPVNVPTGLASSQTPAVQPVLVADTRYAASVLAHAPVFAEVGGEPVSQTQAVQAASATEATNARSGPALASVAMHAGGTPFGQAHVVKSQQYLRKPLAASTPISRNVALVSNSAIAAAVPSTKAADQNVTAFNAKVVASPSGSASATNFLSSTVMVSTNPAAQSANLAQVAASVNSAAASTVRTASVASDGMPAQDAATLATHAAAASSAASSAAKSAASAAEAATIASAAAAKAASAAAASASAMAVNVGASASVSSSGISATATNAGVSVAAASSEEKQIPNLATPNTVNAPSWFWYWMHLNLPQTAQFLEAITFALIIKFMCMAGNVLVQVSPYPQAKRWESRGCTGEVDAAPYVSIAFGGWQWCFYGSFAYIVTQRSGFLVLVHSNCLGAILGTYYTITFYKNCRNIVMLNSLQMYLSAVVSLVVLQICQLFVLPAERALFLTGLVSSFCSFVGAMSMLVPVPTVLRAQDSKAISGPLVCANFASAIVWCICGYMLEDLLVAGPNCFAALSSLVCIVLKWKYPAKDEDESLTKDANTLAAKLALDDKLPKNTDANEFTPLVTTASKKKDALSTSLGPKEGQAPDAIERVFPLAIVPDQSADGTGGTG